MKLAEFLWYDAKQDKHVLAASGMCGMRAILMTYAVLLIFSIYVMELCMVLEVH